MEQFFFFTILITDPLVECYFCDLFAFVLENVTRLSKKMSYVYISGQWSWCLVCRCVVHKCDVFFWIPCRNPQLNAPQWHVFLKIGGPELKLSKKIAPNAIFRVVSCLYILHDLTYSFCWKNSTHSLSYKVYCCFTVFFVFY